MVIRLACVAVLCGFLFGYNEGVVAGAYDLLQAQFNFSPYWGGMLVAGLPLGGLIGAYMSAYLSDSFGRRPTLIFAAFLFLAGAILSGVALELYLLTLGRATVGVAIGIATMAGPQYLSEIAPPRIRGRMLAAFQLMISTGILVSYLADLGITQLTLTGDLFNQWQLMFLLSGVAAALLLVGSLASPESPRWLVLAGKSDRAKTVFQILEPRQTPAWAQERVSEIQGEVAKLKQTGGWLELFSKNIAPITRFTLLAFVIQQLSGINAVIFYAPVMFKDFGFSEATSQLSATVGLGSVLVLAAIANLFIIDRLGRRPLMIWGPPSCGVAQLLIILGISMESSLGIVIAVSGLCLFMVAFSLTIGPLPWIYMSEMFPNHLRAKGMVVAVTVNWVFTLLVVLLFPEIEAGLGIMWVFGFFTIACFLGMIYAIKYAPETKGIPLEELQEKMSSSTFNKAV